MCACMHWFCFARCAFGFDLEGARFGERLAADTSYLGGQALGVDMQVCARRFDGCRAFFSGYHACTHIGTQLILDCVLLVVNTQMQAFTVGIVVMDGIMSLL